VVELHPDRATGVADRHRLVEPAVGDAQLVEHPQRRPGEVAELGVVPLALELGDHHDGEDDLVLVEAPQRPWVGQQDAGVEHVGADVLTDRQVVTGLGRHGSPHTNRRAHSSPRS
jgi:hypothetical protein